MTPKRMPRRDRCYLVGRRAARLDRDQAAAAWWTLAGRLEEMGALDVPKFKVLLHAIRAATITGARADF
jgi:hypothetical protein